MPETVRLTVVLLAVCLISAGALSQTYERTKERIAVNRKAKEAQARLNVIPGAVKVVLDQSLSGNDGGPRVYRGVDKSGKTVGFAFKTSHKGFSGDIVVMVGARMSKGKLVVSGTQVLRHTETPGLGANMNTRNYDIEAQAMEKIPAFQKQFLGKSVSELYLKKTSPKGTLDALTAATISSRAFTAAVREGLEKLGQRLRERSS